MQEQSGTTMGSGGRRLADVREVRSVVTPRSSTDFEDWMAQRQPMLLRTACLLTGDSHTAEDVVQATLAKMYLAWDRLADREHLDSYARRTLLNEYRSLWRRPWRRREQVTADVPESAAPTADWDGRREALWQFVSTLPTRQRMVVVLRYYEELSEAETAQALGVSVGTVKSSASRALSSLRSRIPAQHGLSQEEV
jgi:RNA polymerase sigma-70 factor (sigma-E family)